MYTIVDEVVYDNESIIQEAPEGRKRVLCPLDNKQLVSLNHVILILIV